MHRSHPHPGDHILRLLCEGVSTAEVLAYYLQLVLDDVMACVQFAASTGDEPGFDQRPLASHEE